jgi:hypothetical protein
VLPACRIFARGSIAPRFRSLLSGPSRSEQRLETMRDERPSLRDLRPRLPVAAPPCLRLDPRLPCAAPSDESSGLQQGHTSLYHGSLAIRLHPAFLTGNEMTRFKDHRLEISLALVLFVAVARPTAMAQSLQPPILINPVDGLSISAPSTQAPAQIFTWRAPQAGAIPEFYHFQLQDVTDPSGYSWSTNLVAHARPTISTQQIIPASLRGKTTRWSVSACIGTPPNQTCSSPVSRILNWPSALQAPQHRRPMEADLGPETGTTPRFEWTWVSGANPENSRGAGGR